MTNLATLPSVREVLADVFRNIRLIVLVMLIPPLAAVTLALVIEPVYQADAKLLIKPGREFMPTPNLGQSELGGPSSSMAEIVKSETEILNSQDLAQDVLTKLTIPVVFPDLSDSEDAQGPQFDRAIIRFGKQLIVEPVELSNVVNVSFRDPNPAVAQKVLTVLLSDFQDRHVTLYSNGRSAPIERQIEAKQQALAGLDKQRIEFQKANNAFSVSDQRTSLIQQRAQTAALLQTAEINKGALQEQVDFLEKSRANTPKNTALESENDPSSPMSSSAQTQLMALRQKEQELLQHYQPTAPAVQQIRSQIADAQQFVLKAQTQNNKVRTGANPMMAAIDQQLLAAQSQLTPIASQIEGYKGQVAALDDQLRKLQDTELRVNGLQRQIDSLTLDLQTLQSNLEQARLGENMDQDKISSVSIIDAPRVESRPVFPKRTIFALGGAGVGIALSALIILVSLSFGNTIITVEGAERILNAPVIAALPNLKGMPAE